MICSNCNRSGSKDFYQSCECGSFYCSFHCMVDSLHKVGILQYTFDEMDRCGKCAIDKLKDGKLTFPQGDKHLSRLLAPNLLLYVVGHVAKPKKRKKKIGESQMALF